MEASHKGNKVMKVAILIDGCVYPDCFGGSEIFTYRLASELSKRGHVIHLIARKGRKFHSGKIGNLFFHPIAKRKPLSLLQCLYELVRIRPDVIMAVMLHSALLGYIYARLWNRPLVTRLGGIFTFPRIVKTALKDYIYKNLTFRALIDYTHFVVVSNDLLMKLHNLGVNENRIEIIRNPIDDEFFSISPNLDSDKLVFAGSLKYVKGVDVLVKAIYILKTRFRDLHLLIVGDGQERKKIENLISILKLDSTVKIVGYVPYHSVKDYLSDATIFVLPSRHEGLPNVLLQAMAAGLPIVSTNVGGIPDLIDNGENSLLIPPDDPEELANAVEVLLVNKNMSKGLGMNARKKAEDYKMEKIVRIYEEFLKKTIRAHTKKPV